VSTSNTCVSRGPTFHVEDQTEAGNGLRRPPDRIPISEADFQLICQLLADSGAGWQARHIYVHQRGRNIVVITQTRPCGAYIASLLIAPLWNGYLVFFHAGSIHDLGRDYIVSSCQSVAELCDVISRHCDLPRTQEVIYAGVPRISNIDLQVCDETFPDQW
jgi:hypothetical protein